MKEIIGRILIISEKISRNYMSDIEQDGLFRSLFRELREKARILKKQMAEDARDQIESKLRADIQKHGYKISELGVKLGRYRGSEFITSARITVKSKGSAADRQLLEFLKKNHHPNYQNKGVVDGNVLFNIR